METFSCLLLSDKNIFQRIVFWSMICCFLTLGSLTSAQSATPPLQLATDGFPSGHEIPEGVASDVVRALINRDTALFSQSCIKPYGAGQARMEYEKFLQTTIEGIKQEAARKIPSPRGPKTIAKVFAARHLSANGPASYGYASFGFQDVMFVDVVLNLQNGEQGLNRTLVIKDRDGKWYVHPDPDVSPLLSTGLTEETESVRVFSDAHNSPK